MSPTDQRDKASRLARRSPEQALKVARAIADPWFRAQALAHVARYSNSVCSIARESARAAQQRDDDFKRSAVRSWEVAAMAETGHLKEARHVLRNATSQALLATPASSRCEALILLLHAAARINVEETIRVAEVLRKRLVVDSHWRCIRAVKDAAAILSGLDVETANRFVNSIPEERIRRKCIAAVRDGAAEPRSFFW